MSAVPVPEKAAPQVPGRRPAGKRTWARLIKKVYEVHPLLCPRCSRPLKIVSLIDAPSIIERILRHPKLWDRLERPPPILPGAANKAASADARMAPDGTDPAR